MASRYWVGGSGTWDSTATANWSATSGGTAGASAPTSADTAIFDANSGTDVTVSVADTATCASATINKSDINLSLTGSPTFVGTVSLTTGTVSLNSYALTCGIFSSSNTNARTVAFGTGKIVLTGSGTSWATSTATNMVVTGTPVVELTYAGSLATGIAPGVPTEANSISFYILAGSYDFSFISGRACRDLIFSNFGGRLLNGVRTIYGALALSSGMSAEAGASVTTFAATTGTQTITSNGVLLDFPVTFNGAGGAWVLIDDLTVGSARAITLTNGTLDGNGRAVSLGSFVLGAGTKTLRIGSGVWTVTGSGTAWNANSNAANLTVSASTGAINMTSASAKTFAGGGKTWPTLNQGGTGALTIQQSNTFANITNTVQPATITLTSGTTQTVASFGVSGTAGNLITLDSSSAGSQATLSDSSGVNSVSFVSIKDINAVGGAIWDAPTTAGNVDAGNNLGWNFGIPFNYDIEFSPALRSFTERKQF